MEIGSCHFHRTVFKLPSLISFGQRRLYFPDDAANLLI
nr:hypothetical protein [Escherichia coli]